MKVKVGDSVLILAGKDKGKTGKVLRTLKKDGKVVVEGINIVKKHSKPRTTTESGGIFDIEAPINVSNVKVVDAAKVKEVKKAAKDKKVEDAKIEEVKKETKPKKTTSSKEKKAPAKKASK